MDNGKFYCIFISCLFLGSVVASSSECSGIDEPSRFILCYTDSSVNFKTYLTCQCSHLVVPLIVNITQNNANITLNEETFAYLKTISSRNGGRLRRILSLTMSAEDFSSTSFTQTIISSVARMIDDLLIEGVEIDWLQPNTDDNSKKVKANLVVFMKELHAVLQEKVIVTSIPRSVTHMDRTNVDDMKTEMIRPLILLRLPTLPEQLVKGFDLKPLVRTVDLFVVSTHNMEDAFNVTYHHSRLMGISDILNTDSVLDLITSMGVSSDRIVAAVPTFAVQFRLRDVQQNLPGSHIVQGPTHISHEQLYSILKQGNWTIERDDDLTGTYAYSEKGDWIAFDDEMAAQIKAKYFLLRDIAGVAMIPGNTYEEVTHDWDRDTNQTATSDYPSITQVYYKQFLYQESSERTKRQLARALQNDISSVATTLSSPLYNDRVRASPYRIVRIVARSGETSVIRQPLESSLQCSRQGYYRHPEDCGRFYRCVKFDQFVDDFTVFEYDCPEGLVFDERYEVCTWPSQAAPCGGSSEIRPVPMNRFVCPSEGYFADPENCRWFFACRDYTKDGVSFTQYEFRCPFGLLFDEQNLLCNWPWLVPQCSGGTSLSGSVASSSNTEVIKSEERLDKKPATIPIGSPGYLSGKLVTGEGLYKDPRPAHYGESVVSVGCVDCQSGGLALKEPSPGSYSGKQSKLVLAIPAATIAGESTPVRIIVASPAYSTGESLATSKTSPSFPKTGLPLTEDAYYSNTKSSLQGSSTSKESTGIYKSQKYTDSLTLSGSSDPHVLETNSGNHKKKETSVYSISNNYGQLPSYSQSDNKYDVSSKVSGPIGPSKPDEPISYKDASVKDPTSALDKSRKDELASTPYYLVKSGNGDVSGLERTVSNGKGKHDFSHSSVSGPVEPVVHQGKPSSLIYSGTPGVASYLEKYFETPIPLYEVPSLKHEARNDKIQHQIYTADMFNYKEPVQTQGDTFPINTATVKTSKYVNLNSDPVYSAPAYSVSPYIKTTTSLDYSTPDFSVPSYSAPSYTTQYSAPTSSALAYSEKVTEFKTPTAVESVYSAPANTKKAPEFKNPIYTATVYSSPAYDTEKVTGYKIPITAAPVNSAPVYTEKASEYKIPTTAATTAVYSAPAYTEKASEYKIPTTAAPVYSAPAFTEKVSEYQIPTTAAPVHFVPAYTEKASEYKIPTTAAPVYSVPPYTEKVSEYKIPTTAVPVYSVPTYTEKASEYKIPTTAAPVYSAPAYTEKASEYKIPTTAAPVYSVPAYTEKASEYKIPTTAAPVYSVPAYTEKASEYKIPTTAAPVYSVPAYDEKVSVYKITTIAAPVYYAPANTEKASEYKIPTTAAPVYSVPAYTEKASEYKIPTTVAPVYSVPAYDEKVSVYKITTIAAPVYYAPANTEKASEYKIPSTAAPVYSAPAYTEKGLEYKIPTTAAPVYSAPAYTEKGSEYKIPKTAAPVYSAPAYTEKASEYKIPTTATPIYSSPAYTEKIIRNNMRTTAAPVNSAPVYTDLTHVSAYVSVAPGVAGTRGTGGISGTLGSKSVMRETVYRNPVAIGNKGSTEPEYNPTLDRSSAVGYGKNRSTYSSMSKYSNVYESSIRSGDDTFGRKDNAKSKGKNPPPRLLASKSITANEKGKRLDTSKIILNEETLTNGWSRFQPENGVNIKNDKTHATIETNGNKGSDHKNQTKQIVSELAFRNGSRERESNSYKNEPHSVSINYEKIQDSLINGESVVSFGDKKITVKVPSTNKAALLEKWTKFNPSVVDTDLTISEQKDSTGDYKLSSPRQPIKEKIKESNSQERTSSIGQPNVKLIDSSRSALSLTLNKNDRKELTGIGESEYGHRYLEKITIAQATAKNETLGPEVCVRGGLFRHPSDCQKFYECYWDRWIHQYTVHIFKCPVHLVYDDYITACNWPLDGPACVPHEAVKLYAQL